MITIILEISILNELDIGEWKISLTSGFDQSTLHRQGSFVFEGIRGHPKRNHTRKNNRIERYYKPGKAQGILVRRKFVGNFGSKIIAMIKNLKY